jgi:hypothetical protein
MIEIFAGIPFGGLNTGALFWWRVKVLSDYH